MTPFDLWEQDVSTKANGVSPHSAGQGSTLAHWDVFPAQGFPGPETSSTGTGRIWGYWGLLVTVIDDNDDSMIIILCVLSDKSLQSCPTLCDPMDCSPPVSSVHRILQARILEWVTMPSSRGSSQSRDQTLSLCGFCTAGKFFLPLSHCGSPSHNTTTNNNS